MLRNQQGEMVGRMAQLKLLHLFGSHMPKEGRGVIVLIVTAETIDRGQISVDCFGIVHSVR